MTSQIRAGVDPGLLVVEIGIAVLVSFAVLQLAGRLAAARGRAWALWIAAGAVAIGTGIWSVHFIGMLAHRPPVRIGYEPRSVVLSLVTGLLAAGLALAAGTSRAGQRRPLSAGALTGLAMAAMHQIGVAGVQGVEQELDPVLGALALVVSMALGAVSVRLLGDAESLRRRGGTARGLASLVMGLAFVALHAVGTAAVRVTAVSAPPDPRAILPGPELALAVSMATIVVTGIALFATIFDRAVRDHFRRPEISERNARLLGTLDRTGVTATGLGVVLLTLIAGYTLQRRSRAAELLDLRRDALAHAAHLDVAHVLVARAGDGGDRPRAIAALQRLDQAALACASAQRGAALGLASLRDAFAEVCRETEAVRAALRGAAGAGASSDAAARLEAAMAATLRTSSALLRRLDADLAALQRTDRIGDAVILVVLGLALAAYGLLMARGRRILALQTTDLVQLAAIVDASNDAIIAIGRDGRIISWNPGAERLYGYTQAEMRGESYMRIVPAEARTRAPPSSGCSPGSGWRCRRCRGSGRTAPRSRSQSASRRSPTRTAPSRASRRSPATSRRRRAPPPRSRLPGPRRRRRARRRATSSRT